MHAPQPPSLGPLAGRWQLVRAELDGEPAHELITRNSTLEMQEGGYEIRFGGEVADRGQLTHADEGDNVGLVLRAEHGAHPGRVVRSIYQLRGDLLRICYGLDGVTPAAFATSGGSQRYLAVYRRVG